MFIDSILEGFPAMFDAGGEAIGRTSLTGRPMPAH